MWQHAKWVHHYLVWSRFTVKSCFRRHRGKIFVPGKIWDHSSAHTVRRCLLLNAKKMMVFPVEVEQHILLWTDCHSLLFCCVGWTFLFYSQAGSIFQFWPISIIKGLEWFVELMDRSQTLWCEITDRTLYQYQNYQTTTACHYILGFQLKTFKDPLWFFDILR